MHKFTVYELHLAAYIKSNGATFDGLDGRGFKFTSDISVDAWKVKHSNSCCRRVDIELIGLRNFLRDKFPAEKS
ncbi:hypothetical protein [Pararobbsia silviterrae]|uniref:Uncharacterized protein n=1 Tax=Pararobbsia silviterrae TaxID=1792498 RepID=A0A494X1R6_9BURK|nr:hypothetical protein [Pararobbsia silviterrae]RKP44668.1 hypothetical protein D7S86_26930 [Pararobbsia silviterrae]